MATSEMPKDYIIGDGSDEAILKSIQIKTAATFMAMALNGEDIKTDYFFNQSSKLKNF